MRLNDFIRILQMPLSCNPRPLEIVNLFFVGFALLFCFCFFQDRVSRHPGWPGTHSVNQALNLGFLLFLPLECRDFKGMWQQTEPLNCYFETGPCNVAQASLKLQSSCFSLLLPWTPENLKLQGSPPLQPRQLGQRCKRALVRAMRTHSFHHKTFPRWSFNN